MRSTDIKTVVKQKYGEAALRVKTGGSSCAAVPPQALGAGIQSLLTSMTARRPDRFQRKLCWHHWDAGIQPLWQS